MNTTASCRAQGCHDNAFCSFTVAAPWGLFETEVCLQHLDDCVNNRFDLSDGSDEDVDIVILAERGPW